MNNIEEIQKHIKEARDEIKQLQENLAEKTKRLFHEGMKELFDLYPEVDYIHFTAYTPYFNDGEECTYSCHATDCGFNGYAYYGEKEKLIESSFGKVATLDILQNSRETIYETQPNPHYDPSYRGYDYNKTKRTMAALVPNPDFNPRYLECKNAFRALLCLIGNDTWHSIVDTDVIVLIDREGIKTAEYTDHS